MPSGALGRFSEVPYHLFTEYIQNLYNVNQNLIEDAESLIDLSTDLDFTSGLNSFMFDSKDGFIDWQDVYDTNESKTTAAGYYLDGDNGTIYVDSSGTKQSIYVKIQKHGFVELEIKPIEDSFWINGNELRFEVNIIKQRILTNNVNDVVITNNSEFVSYNYTETNLISYINNLSVYLRKDSEFHQWVLNKKPEYLDDINYRKQFLYLGKIYSIENSTTRFMIIVQGLKDFAVNVFPVNNMNDRLKGLLWTYYDKIYNKIYNLQKNLTTLNDPREIDIKFLGYFTKQYGVEIDQLAIPEDKLREFASNLIALLKRKGTYASAYVIWRAIAGVNQKSLRIYDRWHKNTITAAVSASDWKDYQYINHYGYRRNYPLYPPDEYYTGGDINLDNRSSVTAVAIQSATVTITHNLNTYFVAVQCYDMNFKRIFPKNVVSSLLDTVTISFNDLFVGYVYICAADAAKQQTSLSTANPLLSRYIISQVIMQNNHEFVIPNSIEISDSDFIMSPSLAADTALLNVDYVHTQISPSSEWRIVHDLRYTGSIINIIDNTGNIVYPKEVILSSPAETIVRFSNSINGSAVIRKIGTEISINDFEDFLIGEPDRDLTLSTHYKININHNVAPVSTNEIMTKEIMDGLMYGWELIRPACRVAHYSQSVYPITDFSGNKYSIYSKNSTTWNSQFVPRLTSIPGNNITVINDPVTYHSYTHRLGTKKVLIQCYDKLLNKVYPARVVSTNTQYSTLTFTEPFTGVLFATPADFTEHFVDKLNWNSSHTLSSKNILMQTTYDNTNEEYISVTETIQDESNVLVENLTSTAGSISLKLGDYVHTQDTPSTVWNVNHDLNYIGCMVDVYDTNGVNIKPKNIQLLSYDISQITFETPLAGTAVFKAIGSPPVDQAGIADISDLNAYFKLGNGTDLNWNATLENDIQNEIYRDGINGNVTEDDYNYYFNLHIPVGIPLNITEIGLFNRSDHLVFYTFGKPLYKHTKTELIIIYKILKNIS